jgi:fatty acid desaturase
MSITRPNEDLSERCQAHWVNRQAFQLLVFVLAANQAALAAAVHYDVIWLAVILLITGSHFMHGVLIGFHEASHGLLRENRKFNEFDGVLLGILSFTSFSLYRAAHQSHHVHLATEKDEEFWPFVETSVPRWLRIAAAFLELTAGLIFTPLIFFRAFVRPRTRIRNRRLRRRIWAEYALMAVFWTAVVSTVAWLGAWKYFFWLYLGPAFIAANLQSWRKYIEHVGLTGSTINSSTRSIVAPGPLGRLVALTLLHEPFHGVHHRHGSLPHAELPGHASILEPETPEERPPFRSYRHALVDLLRNLADPRVGPQWKQKDIREPEEIAPSR